MRPARCLYRVYRWNNETLWVARPWIPNASLEEIIPPKVALDTRPSSGLSHLFSFIFVLFDDFYSDVRRVCGHEYFYSSVTIFDLLT